MILYLLVSQIFSFYSIATSVNFYVNRVLVTMSSNACSSPLKSNTYINNINNKSLKQKKIIKRKKKKKRKRKKRE